MFTNHCLCFKCACVFAYVEQAIFCTKRNISIIALCTCFLCFRKRNNNVILLIFLASTHAISECVYNVLLFIARTGNTARGIADHTLLLYQLIPVITVLGKISSATTALVYHFLSLAAPLEQNVGLFL